MPKTIDNDLSATDYTFGFDTAVFICTEAIDRLHTTAESHNRVMVVEVMGRHTGWIALGPYAAPLAVEPPAALFAFAPDLQTGVRVGAARMGGKGVLLTVSGARFAAYAGGENAFSLVLGPAGVTSHVSVGSSAQ